MPGVFGVAGEGNKEGGRGKSRDKLANGSQPVEIAQQTTGGEASTL